MQPGSSLLENLIAPSCTRCNGDEDPTGTYCIGCHKFTIRFPDIPKHGSEFEPEERLFRLNLEPAAEAPFQDFDEESYVEEVPDEIRFYEENWWRIEHFLTELLPGKTFTSSKVEFCFNDEIRIYYSEIQYVNKTLPVWVDLVTNTKVTYLMTFIKYAK